MLAKQPKDCHRRRLDEDDNESLAARENSTRYTSNSPLEYKVNNDDQNKFLREMVNVFGLITEKMKNKMVVSANFMLISYSLLNLGIYISVVTVNYVLY